LTTPLIRALKQKYPSADVDVIVRSSTAPMAVGNKNISHVFAFDAPWFSVGGKKDGWFDIISLINRMPRYDLVIDCHGDPRNIILASFLGRYIVGYGVRGFGFLLNKVVPYEQKYVVERLLDLGRAVGCEGNDKLDLHLNDADMLFAKKIKKKYVTVSAVSAKKEKDWEADSLAEVLNNIDKKITIVFLGTAKDNVVVEQIISKLDRKNIANLTGMTSLREMAGLIKNSILHIGVDTAGSHIARAFNINCITLYLKENPAIWGHNSSKFIKLTSPTIKEVIDNVKKVLK